MLAVSAALTMPGAASASSITYVTPTGATDSVGDPVNAAVTFTTSLNTITVVISNLLVNQKDVGQNISDLLFTVSSGQTSGSISSSSATNRTVNGDGTYSDVAGDASHWAFQTSGSQIYLNDLSGGQPIQTILGSPDPSTNKYTNANSSITGNGPHNPFLAGPVTLTLTVTGVNVDSTITAATFSFGTTAGDNVTGVPVPEPASAVLGAIGLVSLASVVAARRRLTRSRAA